MNEIDRQFAALVAEIQGLSEKELYHRIRANFDQVPYAIQKSCMDFFNQFNYWGRLDPQQGIYEEIEGKGAALFHHIQDFAWLYDHLADYRSKKTLYAILSNWYRYDFITTAQTKESLFDDYFDLDLVTCTPEEVFVDLGAYTGDTVLSYLKNYGEDCYQRIYCYEITPETFQVLQETLAPYRDIVCRQKGVGDAEGTLSLVNHQTSASSNTLGHETGAAVPVTTLDTDIPEPITMIKADIEGFEQKALQGAKNHILRDHPKLLFSVYHNNEDLWKIPRMIHALSEAYTFCLEALCCSGVLGLEELFQALAGLPDGLGMVPAHVPVMPRLIDDAGDVLLLGGVTQDEPIRPAVLHQPLLGGGAGLGLVQDLVTGVHQVHGQPQLVLAGAGHSHLRGGLFLGLRLGEPLGHPCLDQVLIKGGLLCLGAVGGTDQR